MAAAEGSIVQFSRGEVKKPQRDNVSAVCTMHIHVTLRSRRDMIL